MRARRATRRCASLSFTANLQAGANNTVVRAPGSTHVTGTAVSDYGTYTVDVTR